MLGFSPYSARAAPNDVNESWSISSHCERYVYIHVHVYEVPDSQLGVDLSSFTHIAYAFVYILSLHTGSVLLAVSIYLKRENTSCQTCGDITVGSEHALSPGCILSLFICIYIDQDMLDMF